jgi:Holliday junction resolvase
MSASHQNRAAGFEDLLAKLIHRAGWQVKSRSKSGDSGVDLVARHGNKAYLFQIKAASEARKDRALPLISQAILEVYRAASRFPGKAIPVAVFAADHVSESLAEQIEQFAAQNAPDVAIGIIDANGFRRFSGHGLEAFNAKRSSSRAMESVQNGSPSGNLFSDLNQWMLKVLLSEGIPESLLSAPRGHYENASQLAEAAGVSVMSAFRFVRQLSQDGFLEESGGLRLVQVEDLLERWLASQKRVREIPVRWILRGQESNVHSVVRSYVGKMRSRPSRSKRAQAEPFRKEVPRICVAVFEAAEMLGFKFVHGVPPHFYMEYLDPAVLQELGLSMQNANDKVADAYIRIPENPESIFRAAVERDGLLVSDVLQVWLDVSHHPARGKAQADVIRKKVLSHLFRIGRA